MRGGPGKCERDPLLARPRYGLGERKEMRSEQDGILEVPEEERELGGTGGDAGEEDVGGAERQEGEFVRVGVGC